MKVLVTGGTGLVGSAIKEMRPDWIYIGSTEFGSLAREDHVCQMYESCLLYTSPSPRDS